MTHKSSCINMIGHRFGDLTVVARADRNDRGSAYWICRCVCGNESVVLGSSLRHHKAHSCGCLRARYIGEKSRRHGDASGNKKTPEYEAWKHMISRCENSRDSRYNDYGGRGINVYPEWRQSYEAFLAHVGRRPSSDHSLDRYPDTDGNYEPGNVRWATRTEQMRNTRSNRIISVEDMSMTLAEWSEVTGIKRATIAFRIDRLLWSEAKALGLATQAERDAVREEMAKR